MTGVFFGKSDVEAGFCKFLGTVDHGLCYFCYTVRFNGVPSEPFQPTRGLRQGDPLSSYLFLFVADALSLALQNEIMTGDLKELKVSRNAPGVSHLLFADDALVFFEANVPQAERIKQVLQRFQAGSG